MKTKNIALLCMGLGLMGLVSCQNELYKDAAREFSPDQAVYVVNKGAISIFANEGEEATVRDFTLSLIKPQSTDAHVLIKVGSQEQIDTYNKANGTSYIAFPKDMYDLETEVVIPAGETTVQVPLHIKSSIKASLEGDYALPLSVEGKDTKTITKESQVMLLVEKRTHTKVFQFPRNGYGLSIPDILSGEVFDTNQWTMEVMVKIDWQKSGGNDFFGGQAKGAAGEFDRNQLYGRLHLSPTGVSGIEFKVGPGNTLGTTTPAIKFGQWMMFSLVYDGTKHSMYINGELVNEKAILTGPYSLLGMSFYSGNDKMREARMWKVARTPQQIKDNVWKMVNPKDENLLLYYPMNGKKYNFETGEITDDETKVWDWGRYHKDMPFPNGQGSFVNNGSEPYVFPEQ